MTLFAVAAAGLYPLLHVGRPWLDYWLFPYPNTMGMWPNFRSPLIWDVFAVSTYATVSLLFWYVGLIPDLATLRDRSKNRDRPRRVRHAGDGLARLGAALAPLRAGLSCCWPDSRRRSWSRCTPSSASTSPSASCPGWHATIFPPYFVAGAIYAGFAMVLTLAIPLRRIYGLQDFITMQHLNYMGRIVLATGLVVAYGYTMEAFMAWYSGNIYEQFMMINRFTGPYRYMYWSLLFCNVHRAAGAVVPAGALEHDRADGDLHVRQRRHVARALHHHRGEPVGRLPAVVVGTVHAARAGTGACTSAPSASSSPCFFLFIRFLPMISISEMRTMLPEAKVEEEPAA